MNKLPSDIRQVVFSIYFGYLKALENGSDTVTITIPTKKAEVTFISILSDYMDNFIDEPLKEMNDE